MKKLLALALCAVLLAAVPLHGHAAVQLPLKGVAGYPNLPQPYHMLDWKEIAVQFIDLVTDENAQGQYFPVFSWNRPGYCGVERSFAFPSYVGREMTEGGGESVTLFMALLSATLMGMDMRDYKGENLLDTTEVYYNPTLGTFFNNPGSFGGQTFWYEIFPAMLHTMLSYEYPDEAEMAGRDRRSADAWYAACENLGGENLDFDCLSYDFLKRERVFGDWKEPDAAAGIALIEYFNYIMHGDEKHLQAARWCMDWLEKIDDNPLYEVMAYYAPLIGARMNVEQGTNYSVGRFLNWMPGNDSKPRQGWGVINQAWNGYDCYGLAGSESYAGGYAFAMNTFVQSSAIAPVARYDARYADAIGKWLLNAANAVRLFYPNQLPEGHETCPNLEGDPQGVIPYEGLRRRYNQVDVIAMGDPLLYGWADTDRGIYSGAPVGMMAAMMAPTEVEGIVQFDLLKTDYAHQAAYPTYLYFNPYEETKTVSFQVGDECCDLYDSASGSMLMEHVTGEVQLPLAAARSTVVVVVPSGAAWCRRGADTYADGVFVGSARSAIRVTAPADGATVAGAVEVTTRAYLNNDEAQSMVVTLGDEVVYEGPYAESVKADARACAPGSAVLRVRLTTKNGYVETDQVKVKVSGQPSRIAVYNPVQIAETWESIPSMPARIERVGAQAYITEQGDATWGGAMSPWFFIDFDRSATLMLEMGSSNPCVAVQLYVDGAPYGYYLLGDTALDEKIYIDVNEALAAYHPQLKLEGEHAARLYLIATGAEGASIGVKLVSLGYD